MNKNSLIDTENAPLVSIIVPCYNEQATIRVLLEAIYAQTYPRQALEVVIADGMSTDGTREEILAFVVSHPDLEVRVVDNPASSIPSGLNFALEASEGTYIVRLDAHSKPYPDYVERCVSDLEASLGDNVGGVWEIQPGGVGWQARSIAVAASHPLGVGDARYRLGGAAQPVDTVPFGAYSQDLIERIGAYDETLHSNEDYEFNVRVRESGGVVWMDPAIRTIYFARRSLGALARQYWRYGYWKFRMLRRYPDTFRWRQLAGVFVLSFVVLGLFAIWSPFARWLLFLELALYVLVLLIAGVQRAYQEKDLALSFGLPLAIATMHFSWGTAFLWSLISSVIGK
jgi:glycosyltransferase involved in cell wall biosynthesis